MKTQKLFAKEEDAIAVCEAAIEWMKKWRDNHNGYLPLPLFNGLIRLRPGTSTEVIVYKKEEGVPFFWLTLREVPGDDPFNGMWHYPGGVELWEEYELKAIRRVVAKEIGVELTSCQLIKTIHPLYSARADLLCMLFLCTVDGEPKSKEQGRWFSAQEAMDLVPMAQGGIVPSHLVGLHLILEHLGKQCQSPYLNRSPFGITASSHIGFAQEILVLDSITAKMVESF
ncbi:MAG: NUDIX domain-containing protein [Patescibacteria group bacterium]